MEPPNAYQLLSIATGDWRNVALVGGVLVLFFLLGWLFARLGSARRIATLEAMLDYEMRSADERLDSMSEHFSALSSNALRENNQSFIQLAGQVMREFHLRADQELKNRETAIEGLVKPIEAAISQTQTQLKEFDQSTRQSQGALGGQLKAMTEAQLHLQQETRHLSQAMRRPEVRGQWGEITLKRLVELAGMVEYADFQQQVSVQTDEGLLRPDMVVKMPNQRQIVVDVKTPLDAYLAAVEAPDEATKLVQLKRHAKQVRARVLELAQKQYWAQFEPSPDFVVLFIPGDQFLSAALDQDDTLLEYALQKKVILSTPTSLIALLRIIAFGWQQNQLDEETQTVRRMAKDFDQRLRLFQSHLAETGSNLEKASKAYNRAVRSWEKKLTPMSKRFARFNPSDDQPKDPLSALEEPIDRLKDY